MGRTLSAFTRGNIYFYVIYEISFSHFLVFNLN